MCVAADARFGLPRLRALHRKRSLALKDRGVWDLTTRDDIFRTSPLVALFTTAGRGKSSPQPADRPGAGSRLGPYVPGLGRRRFYPFSSHMFAPHHRCIVMVLSGSLPGAIINHDRTRDPSGLVGSGVRGQFHGGHKLEEATSQGTGWHRTSYLSRRGAIFLLFHLAKPKRPLPYRKPDYGIHRGTGLGYNARK